MDLEDERQDALEDAYATPITDAKYENVDMLSVCLGLIFFCIFIFMSQMVCH